MIAGFVDAYGIITYSTYLSFMSGNTTQTAYKIGQGKLRQPYLRRWRFFASWANHRGRSTCAFRGPSVTAAGLRVVAASLALIFVFTQLGFLYGGVHIAVLSFAMGMGNTALSRVGAESVSLTFMTGTLSKLGVHLAMAVRRLPAPDSQGTWTHICTVL